MPATDRAIRVGQLLRPTCDRGHDPGLERVAQGALVESVLADQRRHQLRELIGRGLGEHRSIPVQGDRLGRLRPARPVEPGQDQPALADSAEVGLGRRAELVPRHHQDAVRLAIRVVPMPGHEVGRLEHGKHRRKRLRSIVPLRLGWHAHLASGPCAAGRPTAHSRTYSDAVAVAAVPPRTDAPRTPNRRAS